MCAEGSSNSSVTIDRLLCPTLAPELHTVSTRLCPTVGLLMGDKSTNPSCCTEPGPANRQAGKGSQFIYPVHYLFTRHKHNTNVYCHYSPLYVTLTSRQIVAWRGPWAEVTVMLLPSLYCTRRVERLQLRSEKHEKHISCCACLYSIQHKGS